MTLLRVSGISKRGERGEALNGISFSQHKLQKIAIAGETGSGKSTLLKIIAGLVQPEAGGEIWFRNEKVKGPEETLVPGHSGISYLSQHFDLPKFLRVEQVLAYANVISTEEAEALYDICKISHLLKQKTNQLSGGERQRIALAKLLIASPDLLLLDEPFSNLDLVHKNTLKSVINEIGEKLGITCILVSHDPGDMLSWADEILVLKDGKLLQRGRPTEIYMQPVNEYTAGLFGNYNLMDPEVFTFQLPVPKGKKVLLRPEDFKIVEEDIHTLTGLIKQVTFSGSYWQITIVLQGNTTITIKTEQSQQIGDIIKVSVDPGKAWYV